jgi:hypothetical protein
MNNHKIQNNTLSSQTLLNQIFSNFFLNWILSNGFASEFKFFIQNMNDILGQLFKAFYIVPSYVEMSKSEQKILFIK